MHIYKNKTQTKMYSVPQYPSPSFRKALIKRQKEQKSQRMGNSAVKFYLLDTTWL